MTDLTVANMIFHQLGGHGFSVMTGARDLTGDERSLTCKLGRNDAGVTHLRVRLTDADTYDVEVLRVRAGKVTTLGAQSDVYNDMLRPVVERMTGLRLSLGSLGVR